MILQIYFSAHPRKMNRRTRRRALATEHVIANGATETGVSPLVSNVRLTCVTSHDRLAKRSVVPLERISIVFRLMFFSAILGLLAHESLDFAPSSFLFSAQYLQRALRFLPAGTLEPERRLIIYY